MDPVVVDADASLTETYHDCNSQPTSPRKGDDACDDKENVNGVTHKAANGEPNGDREAEADGPKKSAPLDKKLKKKEDKNMEYVLKALSSLTTPEEKLAALCKKYTDLLDENRQNASALKTASKKLSVVSRERDSLQTESSKLILAKSKLETLCRELQRQNKVVKDESVARQRDDEERRREVASRFQETINDIRHQMDNHTQRNDKLTEDNKELSSKLHTLLEQYEKREEHIQNLLKQKDLESQLMEAKFAQYQKMMEAETRRSVEEKKSLLEQLIESKKMQEVMSQTEQQLKVQLQVYTDKYSEFEATLNRSNEVFTHFKTEMDAMNKKMKKMEKESQTYKARYENTNVALVQMVEQKEQFERIIDMQNKKCEKLEKLCRALQGRVGGSPSPVPTKPADPEASDKPSESSQSGLAAASSAPESATPEPATPSATAEDQPQQPEATTNSSEGNQTKVDEQPLSGQSTEQTTNQEPCNNSE